MFNSFNYRYKYTQLHWKSCLLKRIPAPPNETILSLKVLSLILHHMTHDMCLKSNRLGLKNDKHVKTYLNYLKLAENGEGVF